MNKLLLSNQTHREALVQQFREYLGNEELFPAGFEPRKCLSYLNEACGSGQTKIFTSYICWCANNGENGENSLESYLNIARDILATSLEPAEYSRALRHIDRASLAMKHCQEPPRAAADAPDYSDLLKNYLAAMLSRDRSEVQRLIWQEIREGTPIRDIYLHVFQPALYEVGRLWQINRLSVAEEHFCTLLTRSIMTDIYPEIIATQRTGKSIVTACADSELHEIGICMVADFFEMAGWDTYYIGAGAKPESIVRIVAERKPNLVALSATMTCHLRHIREIIDAIRNAFGTSSPPIMLGGQLFNNTPDQWREQGADLWAPDADQAVVAAQELCGT